MNIEVQAQDVIDSLLAQNRQLVTEITLLKVHLGLNEDELDKETEQSE